LIALGSAVGAAVATRPRLEEQAGKILATAGSFSAISALFGGPLVAGMLLLEAGIGLGAALIPLLVPGLVAASIGYLIFVGFGGWGGLDTTALTVPGLPAYEGVELPDLVIAIGVGVLLAVLVEAVQRLAISLRGRGGSADGRRCSWAAPSWSAPSRSPPTDSEPAHRTSCSRARTRSRPSSPRTPPTSWWS
jgi:H+/Cl- antiporter ClcA